MTSWEQRRLDRIKTEQLDTRRESVVIDTGASILQCRIPRNLCLAYPNDPAPPSFYRDKPFLEWSADYDDSLQEGNVYDVRERDRARCLDEFVRLHQAPDTSYLNFARRWGVLGRCTYKHTMCGSKGFSIWREPLQEWRRYALEFRAILLLAAELQDGKRTRLEYWQSFLRCVPKDIAEQLNPSVRLELTYDQHFTFADLMNSRDHQQELLMASVTSIIRSMDVKIRLAWTDGMGRITVDLNAWQNHTVPSPLSKALALQLCQAVISPKGVYQCDSCGHPFTLLPNQQRPHKGRRACCGSADCKLAQNREAQRRRYERTRSR